MRVTRATPCTSSSRATCRCGSSTPRGDQAILRVLGPDDVVGEFAMVSPGPRAATVTALEPTETMMLDRESFAELRKQRPSVDDFLIERIDRRGSAALGGAARGAVPAGGEAGAPACLELGRAISKRRDDLRAARSGRDRAARGSDPANGQQGAGQGAAGRRPPHRARQARNPRSRRDPPSVPLTTASALRHARSARTGRNPVGRFLVVPALRKVVRATDAVCERLEGPLAAQPAAFTRCDVRSSSVRLSSVSALDFVVGAFGSIFFFSLMSLPPRCGVLLTTVNHDPACPVCRLGDTGCVNPPTFGRTPDGLASAAADREIAHA